MPNTIVRPGTLISAGQVWGGSPAKFVRELNEQEQLANYAASYSASASEGTEPFQLYPREQEEGDKDAETMEKYANRKYFQNL